MTAALTDDVVHNLYSNNSITFSNKSVTECAGAQRDGNLRRDSLCPNIEYLEAALIFIKLKSFWCFGKKKKRFASQSM